MPGFPYGRGTVYSRLESPMESYGEPCLFMPIACSPLLLCKSDEKLFFFGIFKTSGGKEGEIIFLGYGVQWGKKYSGSQA